MTRAPAHHDPTIRPHRPLYRLPGALPWQWGTSDDLDHARTTPADVA